MVAAQSESGFTLVMVVIVIAVMAIMMAVAVQAVSFSMRREREAELVFRGEQYVEAIRLYKGKFGRYPTQLKELWEAKPRVIRRQWKDPMTDSLSWGLVFLGQEGQELAGSARRRPSGEQTPAVPTPTPPTSQEPGERPFGAQEGEKVGPIVGVHSTSCEESIRVYEGRTRYCDWKFVYEEEQQQGGRTRPQVPFGMRPPRETPPPDATPQPTRTPPPAFPTPSFPRRRPPDGRTTPTPR